MDEKLKNILKTLAELIYDQFIKDYMAGNLRKDQFQDCKQAVGKSAKKAKIFHQPALDYDK